jgi:acyl-CoA reductase-like NAD-dependent aldehyde dehydrogenase
MIATETKVATVSCYINGAWEKPQGRTMGTVMNPATGAVLAEVPFATESDVDRAVRAAHQAFL